MNCLNFMIKFQLKHLQCFILSTAGPTVIHPQYYSVQTPWGIYPANIIPTQGQQTPQGIQQMRGGSGRLTPSGQSDSGTPMQQQLPAQGWTNFMLRYFRIFMTAKRFMDLYDTCHQEGSTVDSR
jgi:hypothetical protein